MIYRPKDLRFFLNELGIKPKKRLSQNFLIDGNIIHKIIAFAEVKKGDVILEIGPGPGALTQALLAAGAHVVAIEKDAAFAKTLSRLQTEDHRLTVIEDNALVVQLENLLEKKAKLIANLPYHLTTPILSKLAPMHKQFESLTVMVQKEVAGRFVAPCGSKDYSSFSVFLQFYSQPIYGFTVQPTCFYPRPKIKSAVVKLILKKPPPLVSVDDFFKMVRTAFQKRRKMARVSLKELYGTEIISSALESIGKDPFVRPEELSLDDFLRLFQIVKKS